MGVPLVCAHNRRVTQQKIPFTQAATYLLIPCRGAPLRCAPVRSRSASAVQDLLKKRKITGLCIKSKRFIVGGRDCRLIVYPRGEACTMLPACSSASSVYCMQDQCLRQAWTFACCC